MKNIVLAVGAHPDDEVLGPGGTLAKHASSGDEVHVLIVTEGTTQQYTDAGIIEEKKAAAKRCATTLGVEEVHFADLPDMRLDNVSHVEVNAAIEDVVESIGPDVVYTHSPYDVNHDHVAVFESTMVATRPPSGVERVLTYEVPSATDWNGKNERFTPNQFVEISGYLDQKVDAFVEYETEVEEFPHPRSRRAIRACARARGATAGFDAAEAHCLCRAYLSSV